MVHAWDQLIKFLQKPSKVPPLKRMSNVKPTSGKCKERSDWKGAETGLEQGERKTELKDKNLEKRTKMWQYYPNVLQGTNTSISITVSIPSSSIKSEPNHC
uniref:Uncharacterized protein n=1 Tax=Oryza sativa subsp. japonica TaxID=39947 RepID=Q60D91_ORYSJ|nr:hypothetical protein [Oryza sativa Japonica Group]AAW56855.1 hypothetical protein [Oryza sativa Japonica Group]